VKLINDIVESIKNFFRNLKKDIETEKLKENSNKYAKKTIKTSLISAVLFPISLRLFILFAMFGQNMSGMPSIFGILIFWILVLVLIIICFNLYFKGSIYLYAQLKINKTKITWISLAVFAVSVVFVTYILILFFIFGF